MNYLLGERLFGNHDQMRSVQTLPHNIFYFCIHNYRIDILSSLQLNVLPDVSKTFTILRGLRSRGSRQTEAEPLLIYEDGCLRNGLRGVVTK